jgi:hypothetical protein
MGAGGALVVVRARDLAVCLSSGHEGHSVVEGLHLHTALWRYDCAGIAYSEHRHAHFEWMLELRYSLFS